MMEKFMHYILHPFFMSVYPILFLLSINAGQIPLQQAGRILALSLAAALLLTLLLGALFRDFRRGGFLTSILLALFFSYGQVYNFLDQRVPDLANYTFLSGLWGILLVAGIWAVYKTQDIGTVNKYLNIMMLFMLIQPVVSIGLFVYKSGAPEDVDPFDNIQTDAQGDKGLPDIYYIILDGHGRSDVVNELFGYDNSAFISHLQEKGFYVADQSHSNYMQTYLSLPSSLNYNYLSIKEGELQSADRTRLSHLIEHSRIRDFLKKQGYQTVAFSTGNNITTLTQSDIFIPYATEGILNNFEGLVFSTSAASRMISNQAQQKLFVDPFKCENRRGYILNIFENLKKIPDLPGSKFVFAHILAPHPPFVFAKNGSVVDVGCGWIKDGSYFSGTQSEYMNGYSQQIEYIDTLTQEVVDIILEKSPSSIIIIQGDHGSGMLLDWDSPENSCLRERFSILNAYYFPDQKYDQFDETISPVNSFRLVLNKVFGRNLPLLEDRSYYSRWDTPYQLVDVTGKMEDVCQVKK